ncbi:tRNA-uridine aminocarboxypropyltransferase [Pseudoalteromonas sp. ZZD1]|uniref:tRNA-uridine aminocarboxypropyltransferase n=1 Tax=Pseudoalteromonas sp. ZZD1 TaxID=3139395 RepID=UPI003BA878EB
MSRAVCEKCQYSVVTCLCKSLVTIKNQTHIIILQHPSETKITKNTAKLLNFCLARCTLIQGESDKDFKILDTLPAATTALLYPDDDAIMLDKINSHTKQFCKQLTHLVLLDGTWKKAFKIMQLTPKLTMFKKVSFATVPTNRYRIRKAPRADSLSSLEAVAHSLMLIEQCDSTPLYQVLDALNDKQTQFMPEHVKARYLNP